MGQRIEATLAQWKELYEVTLRIKALKPWEHLEDMDLFAVRKEKETYYYSILGYYGNCIGIVVYKGNEGFNNLLMVADQGSLNLPNEQILFNQTNLTLYFGDRKELSKDQYEVIKDLGYKFRGKNEWPYFMSFKPGLFPYQLDQEEVLQMTEHLLNLEKALHIYFNEKVDIHFNEDKLFMYDAIHQTYSEEDYPFISYRTPLLEVDDKNLINDLQAMEKNNGILEIDAVMMATNIIDKKWPRPINMNLCVVADKKSGTVMSATPIEPLSSVFVYFANSVLELIFRYGRFKEIHISSPYYRGALEHICKICDMKLVVSKKLPAINSFMNEMSDPLKKFH